jgi:putative membrane protein insertion efficiency factor
MSPAGPSDPRPTLAQRAVLALLRGYRAVLSPLLGQRCRFHPSCSHYAGEAVSRFGVARGGVLALFRVLRCQPLCEGGIDPVPQVFPARPWRRAPAPAPPDAPP